MNFEEGNLIGKKPEYSLDDKGGHTLSTYWFFVGETNLNLSVIRAYTARELPDPGWPPYGWPDQTTTIGLLAASTSTNFLYRSFRPLHSSSGPAKSEGLVVPENGLFFDSYINLGSSDKMPDAAAVKASGDKIQVMLYRAEDAVEDGVLVVTASSIGADGLITPVNFTTTNRLSAVAWHRLTARLIPNAATRAGETISALALWIDGERVSCADAEYAAKIGAGAAERFVGNAAYEERALFPILQTSETKMRAYAFGVGGETLVDDIRLGEENPLDHPADEIEMVLVCDDAAFSAMKYQKTPSGGAAEPEVVLTKPFSGTKVTVRPGDEVTFTPTKIERAAVEASFTLSGNPSAVASLSGYTVVFSSDSPFASAERLVASIKSTVYNFTVNGRDCVTFTDAVAYANTNGVSNVIALKGDVELAAAATSDGGQARVLPSQDVVLDLCGAILKGAHFNEEAAIYDQGRLEIIDSVGGGAIEAVGDAIEVVAANDALDVNHEIAEMSIGRATVTNQFRIHGRVRVSNTNAVLAIRTGEFLTPPGVVADSFYLERYRADRTAEPERFDVVGTGTYWRVSFDGRHKVSYVVAHGEVTPSVEWKTTGETLTEPTLVSPGYTNGGWYVEGAAEPREKWVFGPTGTKVEKDLILEASLGVEGPYSITYDPPMTGLVNPSAYTVESPVVILGEPSSNVLQFVGWRDANSGHLVKRVGAWSKFADADLVVSGDLDLKAEWRKVPMSWSNSVHSASVAESNGTYRGSWQLKFPKTWAKQDISGRLLKIREIDFCLVNPHLYPKTAPCLAVKTNETDVVVSSVCTNYYNEATRQYEVGTNLLANGRAKIAYFFDDLYVRADVSNEVFFTDAATNRVNGFLRLGYGAGREIGNCLGPGGDLPEPSAAYLDYAPIYEIFGEAAE